MKHYIDPELEVVCFETEDNTNYGSGEGPDFPGDDLSQNNKGFNFLPGW